MTRSLAQNTLDSNKHSRHGKRASVMKQTWYVRRLAGSISLRDKEDKEDQVQEEYEVRVRAYE